ncbi:hypothetical protein IV203_037673 [Nitzschia inconspicua]|uniref:Uncharacterized protein n=1 Tax=Nitzschia inconspicua TaxID=303405 RepID=A0A9K3LPZ6_9STRA|nr:hypothetical protein IV203_037673 [Nitzschia inconspicua]
MKWMLPYPFPTITRPFCRILKQPTAETECEDAQTSPFQRLYAGEEHRFCHVTGTYLREIMKWMLPYPFPTITRPFCRILKQPTAETECEDAQTSPFQRLYAGEEHRFCHVTGTYLREIMKWMLPYPFPTITRPFCRILKQPTAETECEDAQTSPFQR